MIIDCHGHYTTAPPALQKFRDAQMSGGADGNKFGEAFDDAEDQRE